MPEFWSRRGPKVLSRGWPVVVPRRRGSRRRKLAGGRPWGHSRRRERAVGCGAGRWRWLSESPRGHHWRGRNIGRGTASSVVAHWGMGRGYRGWNRSLGILICGVGERARHSRLIAGDVIISCYEHHYHFNQTRTPDNHTSSQGICNIVAQLYLLLRQA